MNVSNDDLEDITDPSGAAAGSTTTGTSTRSLASVRREGGEAGDATGGDATGGGEMRWIHRYILYDRYRG